MLLKIRIKSAAWLKRWGISLFLISMFTVSFLNVSSAADYPVKPIQVIVPFPAGGGADIVARIIINKVSTLLGQPVVVFNKTGGGGAIGTYAVLAAPPDGYTILAPTGSMIMLPFLTKGITFDFIRDFTLINLAATAPTTIIVRKDSPLMTFDALYAEAKKNPGKVTCSISSLGGGSGMGMHLFKMHTGLDVSLIPMEGTVGALNGVLGGHLDFGAVELSGAPYIQLKAGTLRALTVMANKRHKDFPDTPTTVEKGFPNIVSVTFEGFVVRKGTPQAIVKKLSEAFKEALKDREIMENLQKTGWVIDNLGMEAAEDFFIKEQKKYSEVVKAAKIVPQ